MNHYEFWGYRTLCIVVLGVLVLILAKELIDERMERRSQEYCICIRCLDTLHMNEALTVINEEDE